MSQQHRTHHGRQGERHQARDQHSTGQGQRKLTEQLTCSPWRESQRCKHSRQSERHGHNGKANFLSALDGRGKRIEPLFNVAVNVFQHHDGIVHHQSDGQNKRQQGQCIDGEASQSHDGKSAHQTHGNGHDRNDGGPYGSQEDKNHNRDQNHGFKDGLKNALDGFVNEHRVVVGHIDHNVTRQILLQLRNHFTNAFGQFQRIGCGLSNHPS